MKLIYINPQIHWHFAGDFDPNNFDNIREFIKENVDILLHEKILGLYSSLEAFCSDFNNELISDQGYLLPVDDELFEEILNA